MTKVIEDLDAFRVLHDTARIDLQLVHLKRPPLSTFKKILLPIGNSEHAIHYAVDLARQSEAKLYLLRTYRLLEEVRIHKSVDKSLKSSLDDLIEEEFFSKYRELLDRSGVDYELLVEVGFLFDRISANIQERGIDMLLIDKHYPGLDEPLRDQFKKIMIPVLLIPEVAAPTYH